MPLTPVTNKIEKRTLYQFSTLLRREQFLSNCDYVLLVGIVGASIAAMNALRCTEPATIAEKWVTSELSVDRQHKNYANNVNTQMAVAFTWIQFLQLETVTPLFVR